MQALRPSPDPLNQNLPFNKTPRGSIHLATSEINLYKKSLKGNESLSSLAFENFYRDFFGVFFFLHKSLNLEKAPALKFQPFPVDGAPSWQYSLTPTSIKAWG